MVNILFCNAQIGATLEILLARSAIKLLAVGRLRTAHWKTAATHYSERLNRWYELREVCVADGDAALPIAVRCNDESTRLLAALSPQDVVVCLDERGTACTSRQFSDLLARLTENATRTPCFVLGGAFGFNDTIRATARHMLSFGPMTLPHELARVVLLEQLYRAACIVRNVPYHHE